MGSSVMPLLLPALLLPGASADLPLECQEINNHHPTLPECTEDDIRFRDDTIVVRGEVTCTLSRIAEDVPERALSRLEDVANGWRLGAPLLLEEGARLHLHGSGAGGDVDLLRLRSDSDEFVDIRAEWGSIDIRATRIVGWDTRHDAPDQDHDDGRAYIHVRSFKDGDRARESRMDIADSELSHLGYFGGSAYGLSWRVDDTGSSGEDSPVFDEVEVYGTVRNSHIHHAYYGIYSWGALCMEIVGNELHDNVMYGIDPHDNSDHLLIASNYVHHNGQHGIICSKNCDHLVIRNNISAHNANHGIMLHMNVTDSVVESNRVHGNGSCGIAVFESHRNLVVGNDSFDNETGIRVYRGSVDNHFEDNVLHDNESGLYFSDGADDNVAVHNILFDNDDDLDGDRLRSQDVDDNSFERIDGHDHPPGEDGVPLDQDARPPRFFTDDPIYRVIRATTVPPLHHPDVAVDAVPGK
ncbi:MAG: right-handed parallel beta-helix repeat-containing protein [Myxococcota bacterium]